MKLELSQLFKNTTICSEIESILNKYYYDESKNSLLSTRTCNTHFPEIKRIASQGFLKILVFSDYRTQKIEELFHFLRQLKEKPDLIIYAGDDVSRFAPFPEEVILHNSRFSCYEIECVMISDNRVSSPSYDFILRLPKPGADENTARSRIFEVKKFMDMLYEKLHNGISSVEDLKKLLTGYPTFQLREKASEREGTKRIDVIDTSKGSIIVSIYDTGSRFFTPHILSGYSTIYDLIKYYGSSSIVIKKIFEDQHFSYFLISLCELKYNVFEELANYAKFGLVAVIGNNDAGAERLRIHGRNVYEVHNTWIEIGQLLIVGLEGSTCGLGPSGHYSEGSVRLRLELAREIAGNKKLLIVSHTPPRGVLDRAMRFGDEAIGSLALRDFLEENENVVLVICGHVHRCGGKHERVNNATVINVSSHDDPFSRANVAWVLLDQNEGIKEIEWFKLPSLVGSILRSHSEDEALLHLQKEAGLSRNEALLFIKTYHMYGNKLLEDLEELARLKFQYGFSWDNVFRLYRYGVKASEHITRSIYERVLNESCGLNIAHLKKAYAKILRERESGNVYLINPIPLPDDNQMVVFDTEYSPTEGVLYGFLDLQSMEFKQFWFDEKTHAKEFLHTKRGKIFVHWGGRDRLLLQSDLGCQAPTLNLLYRVQTSLVAPISSTTLRETHDALCGTLAEDEFWKRSFYEIDGFGKLMLCNRILRNPSDMDAREELAAANKADILALQHVIEKLRQLNKGVRLHPHKIDKQESIKETIHPIINQDMFNNIVHSFYKSMVKHVKKSITNELPEREREFLTLFKVLRKALLFSNQGDLKKARFYLGLVKREWNFLSDELPDELRMKIETLLRNIRSAHTREDMEKLERDLRSIIIEYLERNISSDDLDRFKKVVFKQDKSLEKKAFMKKLK